MRARFQAAASPSRSSLVTPRPSPACQTSSPQDPADHSDRRPCGRAALGSSASVASAGHRALRKPPSSLCPPLRRAPCAARLRPTVASACAPAAQKGRANGSSYWNAGLPRRSNAKAGVVPTCKRYLLPPDPHLCQKREPTVPYFPRLCRGTLLPPMFRRHLRRRRTVFIFDDLPKKGRTAARLFLRKHPCCDSLKPQFKFASFARSTTLEILPAEGLAFGNRSWCCVRTALPFGERRRNAEPNFWPLVGLPVRGGCGGGCSPFFATSEWYCHERTRLSL